MTLQLVSATIANGTMAVTIALAMRVGLIVPKLVIDYLSDRSTDTGSATGKENIESYLKFRRQPSWRHSCLRIGKHVE